MEVARLTLYSVTILSATVTWCLAAAFLALTDHHLDHFWRGDVTLLVFGLLAMLVLPCLMCLGSDPRRKNLTGPTIAETLTVFVFWAIFLSATAKFSASYHTLDGWRFRCRLGFTMCPTGRALLSFGWITFGFLSALVPVVIFHGISREKDRKRANDHQGGDIAAGRQIVAPSSNPSQTTTTVVHPTGGGEGKPAAEQTGETPHLRAANMTQTASSPDPIVPQQV